VIGLSLAMTAIAFKPRNVRSSSASLCRIRPTASGLGLINSLAGWCLYRYRRRLNPRKSKPSSRATMRVLSSLKARPLGASQSASFALTCSVCWALLTFLWVPVHDQ
jgi:hypothetical protein